MMMCRLPIEYVLASHEKDPDRYNLMQELLKLKTVGESQMKLTEAETLIKQWRECKDRMVAVNNLANSYGKVVVRNSGTTVLELTTLETKMLMNILHNTIYEREQNLRERIVNELHIDVEA